MWRHASAAAHYSDAPGVAMPARLAMPEARLASITGRTLAANLSVPAIQAVRPRDAAMTALLRMPRRALQLPGHEGCACALGDPRDAASESAALP